MLLQRTVFTGWLCLIDQNSPILRLVTALVIAVSCLAALLMCAPYKSNVDFGLAAGGQFLLVCCFLGAILVKVYDEIVNDPLGNALLAQRFLGLESPDDVVTLMITVAMCQLVVFSAALIVHSYLHAQHLKREAKWSICTLDPPSTKWRPQGTFAAFLSHVCQGYSKLPSSCPSRPWLSALSDSQSVLSLLLWQYKMEAASDARYLHDTLRKMLKSPIFLDSSSLSDLRKLISDGLCNSDVLVLMLTDGVLTRPWYVRL